jgi:ABC-2 type transport system permease protein
MPLHDLGYRAWQGRLEPQRRRWWVIAQTGSRLAWKSRWLRRLLLVAWLPMVYMGAGFFVYEQWVASPDYDEWVASQQNEQPTAPPRGGRARAALPMLLSDFPELRAMLSETARDAGAEERARASAHERHQVWSWLLSMFFRYPQGVLLVLVVGLIAPPLIAQDVRSRAFLLYFSRPLNRLEYIAGKAAAVSGYVLMITTLPALVLYVLGLLLSPGLNVALHTWDLPLRILASSVVLLLPTVSLALAFSSLTAESRYAGFAWFAVWVLGWVAYTLLLNTTPMPPVVADDGTVNVTAVETARAAAADRWSAFSLYHTLGKVQNWVFGFKTDPATLFRAMVLLAGLTVGSWMVLFRRVSSPMRI